MKLTCDLCDGSLQMNNDGQGAVCTVCGILYPMARLKEKLKSQPAGQTNGSETRETPAPAKEVPFVPQPFILNLTKGNGDLSGYVQQGGIGLGDNIYINGDYSRPYTIYSINDDYNVVSVKQGMNVDLFVSNCPSRTLRNASAVTGTPTPIPNAYNFPGTVREYFAHLLRCEFSEYEIRTNIPHDALSIPADFVLIKDGKNVLAIFLINSNNSKERWQVTKAERILAANGTSVVHFFDNYRNDKPYVIERIKKALSLPSKDWNPFLK